MQQSAIKQQKFTKEQIKYLESFFEVIGNSLENIQSTLKLINESLLNSHEEQNVNISVYDIYNSLTLLEQSFNPINTELLELSTNANYIFWDTNKKIDFNFGTKLKKTSKLLKTIA